MLSAEEVYRLLDTDSEGLSSEEGATRLARFGPNEIGAERVVPWWRLLLRQFRDPLVYILLIAAALTLVLSDYRDTGVILAVVLLNAVIGFVQEMRAREAIRGLARLGAPKAQVMRNGRPRLLESRGLVPGDLVLLASGAAVPADLRLVSTRDLEVDESMLTGESVPVRKTSDRLDKEVLVAGDRVNLAFTGTVVTRGRGRGVVVRTGGATELGRIATAIRTVGTTLTPLQEKMHRFGRRVGVASILLSTAVLVIGLMRGLPSAEIILTAVAVTVSAIPEGLPVVLTVTLAIGVARMARRNAIIRSLPAVETLGSTTTIGSDKTGTLTRNEMTVTAIWAGGTLYDVAGMDIAPERSPLENHALAQTLLAGVLANEADPGDADGAGMPGDPTETALFVAAARVDESPAGMRRKHPEADVLPFEPERRFMASLNVAPDGRRTIYLKGAPEVVIARCSSQMGSREAEPLDARAALAAAHRLGARGLRVLAMACKPVTGDRIEEDAMAGGFRLAGLQGMEDPVRPEAIEAVASAHRAGIRVLMLTGDQVNTARAIGRELGIGGSDARAVEGSELEFLSDEEVDRTIRETSIYARVAPEHKLRLVERLKAGGEIVAVTGDGVNDAPALRAAHIGIAMGLGGTDIAREASDMVLADDNFATITAAIEEGRIVFSNIRKVTFFLLSTAVGEAITILFALVAGWPLPFLAAQILWINLVTNGLQDVALAFERGEPGLLGRPPRSPAEGILTTRLTERLGAVGLVLAAGTLGVFWWSWSATGDVAHARTLAMTQMVVFQFFHVFNCRSLDRSVFRMPLFSNRFLFVSIVAAALAHLAVLHNGFLQDVFRTGPLTPTEWWIVLGIGSTVIAGGELDKWWSTRKGRPIG